MTASHFLWRLLPVFLLLGFFLLSSTTLANEPDGSTQQDVGDEGGGDEGGGGNDEGGGEEGNEGKGNSQEKKPKEEKICGVTKWYNCRRRIPTEPNTELNNDERQMYGVKRPFKIRNTTEDVHVHMIFDEYVWDNQLHNISYHKDISRRYDFIWGTVPSGEAINFKQYGTQACFDILELWDSRENRSYPYWKQRAPQFIMYKYDRHEMSMMSDFGASTGEQTPLNHMDDEEVEAVLDEWIPEAMDVNVDSFCIDRLSFQNDNQRVGHFNRKKTMWEEMYSGEQRDEKFYVDVREWYGRFRDRMHTRDTDVQYLVPSFMFQPVRQKDKFVRLLKYLDGVYDEGGFCNRGYALDCLKDENGMNRTTGQLLPDGTPDCYWDWDTMYDTKEQYEGRMKMIMGVQRGGIPNPVGGGEQPTKPYFLTGLVPWVGPQEEEYQMASYLIGKYQSCTTWIGTEDDYFKDIWRQIYDIPIGVPCDKAYQTGNNREVWSRWFTGGVVVVNSDNKMDGAEYDFGGSYNFTEYATMLYFYEPKITLDRHLGRIFLYSNDEDLGCRPNPAKDLQKPVEQKVSREQQFQEELEQMQKEREEMAQMDQLAAQRKGAAGGASNEEGGDEEGGGGGGSNEGGDGEEPPPEEENAEEKRRRRRKARLVRKRSSA